MKATRQSLQSLAIAALCILGSSTSEEVGDTRFLKKKNKKKGSGGGGNAAFPSGAGPVYDQEALSALRGGSEPSVTINVVPGNGASDRFDDPATDGNAVIVAPNNNPRDYPVNTMSENGADVSINVVSGGGGSSNRPAQNANQVNTVSTNGAAVTHVSVNGQTVSGTPNRNDEPSQYVISVNNAGAGKKKGNKKKGGVAAPVNYATPQYVAGGYAVVNQGKKKKGKNGKMRKRNLRSAPVPDEDLFEGVDADEYVTDFA